MDLQISTKTALVCASTSGLGEAVARSLTREGVRTVITGRRFDRARAIAGELPGAQAIRCDFSQPEAAWNLFSEVQSSVGPPDILILNGPGPAPSLARDVESNGLRTAIDSAAAFQVELVRFVLPKMLENKWGRIVCLSSSGVVAPIPGLALSNMARSALGGYLKTLSREVASDGVTVNLVAPGRIDTARLHSVDESAAKRKGVEVEQIRKESRDAIPIGRYGTVEEFASAVTFLCSEQASYVTGSVLRCDGGLVASL